MIGGRAVPNGGDLLRRAASQSRDSAGSAEQNANGAAKSQGERRARSVSHGEVGL